MNSIEHSSGSMPDGSFEERTEARNKYFQLANAYALENGIALHHVIVNDYKTFLHESGSSEFVRQLRTYEVETNWGPLKLSAYDRLATTPLPTEHVIGLSVSQNNVFEILMRNPDDIHSYEVLAGMKQSEIDDPKYRNAAVQSVRAIISQLRTRLGHSKEKHLIHTVIGEGYTLSPNWEISIANKNQSKSLESDSGMIIPEISHEMRVGESVSLIAQEQRLSLQPDISNKTAILQRVRNTRVRGDNEYDNSEVQRLLSLGKHH